MKKVNALVAGVGLLGLFGCGAEASMGELEPTEQSKQAVALGLDPVAAGVSVSISDRAGSFDCDSLGLCEGFAPIVYQPAERHGRGSNSQLALGHNLYLGDIDGDMKTDVIQHDDHRVFVSNGRVAPAEVGHLVLPDTIDRLIVGDFMGIGWDQLCVLSSAAAHCFGADPSKPDEGLRLWFRQVSNPIAAAEDVIVGNFDADLGDELFLYDKASGEYRMLEYRAISGVKQFAAKTSYSPGNLTNRIGTNMGIRAGDYNGDGRTDLLAFNGQRQMIAFKSVYANDKDTFWWMFTTAGNIFSASEEYSLASIDSDGKDDLVLHDQTTGALRFKRVEYNDGNPRLLTNSTGQLHIAANSHLRPSRGHIGAPNRDDMYLLEPNRLHAYAAATTDSGNDTYWWTWSKAPPPNDGGWPSTKVKKVLYVPCMFSDNGTKTISDTLLDEVPNRVRDYYWELTMGRLDLRPERTGWVQIADSSTSAVAGDRALTGKACAQASGKDYRDYDMIVAIKNVPNGDDWTSGQWSVVYPGAFDVFFTAHELGHQLGMDHSSNDSPLWPAGDNYGNPWNVMSAGVGFKYLNDLGVNEGPGITAPGLRVLGATNARRIKVLEPGYAKQTVMISAVNRPAAGFYNELQIKRNDSTKWMYSVEFRERSGYDRDIPRDTVIIHRTRTGAEDGLITSGALQTEQNGQTDLYANRYGRNWVNSERQPGESWSYDTVGTVKVLRFVDNMAEVEITPP